MKGMTSDPYDNSSIWEGTSYDGAQFRRRFALPYVMFNDICNDWAQTGKYHKEFDRCTRPQLDHRLFILGCLRVLAKGSTFDLIDELTDISHQHNHYFFGKFISWFNHQYFDKYIKLLAMEDEIKHVEQYY